MTRWEAAAAMGARAGAAQARPALSGGLLLALLLLCLAGPGRGAVVVIGHASLHKLETTTVQRIYAGKLVEVDGQAVKPVHLPVGHPLRQRFLAEVLQQTEDSYVAYWTVRRYVGKGVPPRELPSPAAVLNFVQSTPGAIGYVDESDLLPGVNVLMRVHAPTSGSTSAPALPSSENLP